jgi:hypothetical protein
MVEDGDLTESEGRRMKAKNMSGIDLAKDPNARGGRGGAGGGKGAKVTEAEVKGLVKGAERHIAARLGIQMHPQLKRWVTADGKRASPEQMAAFNEGVRLAEVKIRDNAATNTKTPLSGALAAADAAEPAKPAAKDQFTVGQIYTNPKGQRGKYLGNGKWEEVK